MTDAPGGVPSKFDLLLAMTALQPRIFSQMFDAQRLKNGGNLDAARSAFEELRQLQRSLLEIALVHNAHHEQPFDIPPVAQALKNTVVILAGLYDGLGDREAAERLRDEAQQVALTHLGAAGNAGFDRLPPRSG